MATKDLLIIANNQVFQLLISRSLEQQSSWSIMSASSGQKGIIKAEIYQPDVILLDMEPALKSLHILERLWANPRTKSIPVILLMTQMQQTHMLQLERNEIAGIITRPFDSSILDSQISQILDWQVEKNYLNLVNTNVVRE